MQARTLEPVLSQHPFFQGIDPKYLALLTGCASSAVWIYIGLRLRRPAQKQNSRALEVTAQEVTNGRR